MLAAGPDMSVLTRFREVGRAISLRTRLDAEFGATCEQTTSRSVTRLEAIERLVADESSARPSASSPRSGRVTSTRHALFALNDESHGPDDDRAGARHGHRHRLGKWMRHHFIGETRQLAKRAPHIESPRSPLIRRYQRHGPRPRRRLPGRRGITCTSPTRAVARWIVSDVRQRQGLHLRRRYEHVVDEWTEPLERTAT